MFCTEIINNIIVHYTYTIKCNSKNSWENFIVKIYISSILKTCPRSQIKKIQARKSVYLNGQQN